MSLIAFQTSAVNLGHYHQDGRKIFSNVPAKCIQNNVLVCSPSSIISINEQQNIQNKDLGSIKTNISIEITEGKQAAKPLMIKTEKKPILDKVIQKTAIKAVPQKPINVLTKVIEKPKKVITPIIAN